MHIIGSIWTDIGAPLILAAVGGGIAVFWPWLQSYWRGRKFQGIIRRELEELMPVPLEQQPNTPWWAHLRKRFVHEEVFAREKISDNRDFLLSLDPTVVYLVSQLWTAYAKRDADQWLYFMDKLARDEHVGGSDLRNAHGAWCTLIAKTCEEGRLSRVRDSKGPQAESLLNARLDAYEALIPLTDYGPEDQPLAMSLEDRGTRATEMMVWFYERGGLLMSSDALVAFRLAHQRLTASDADDHARRKAFSALRTELKIELGVGSADERDIEMATIGGASPRSPS
jgi:hypothetical protein